MRIFRHWWRLVGALALLPVATVQGQDTQGQERPVVIGQYGQWHAWTLGSGAGLICYIASQPAEASLRNRRGDITMLVWHKPGEDKWDVVQVNTGYTFKAGSEVSATIGRGNWSLFTQGGIAWADNSQEDMAIVKAMRAGQRMTVKGTSSRNNTTTDVYSLSGVTRAHNAINEACSRP